MHQIFFRADMGVSVSNRQNYQIFRLFFLSFLLTKIFVLFPTGHGLVAGRGWKCLKGKIRRKPAKGGRQFREKCLLIVRFPVLAWGNQVFAGLGRFFSSL